MNNAQDMSPDFVLMRLVSAAEYDRLDEDNLMSGGGVVSGFGKGVLGHHGNINNGFEFDLNNTTAGPALQSNPSPHASSQQDSGTGAADSGVMLTRPSEPDPPPADFSVAQRFEFSHSAGRGSRAQLMVFQNLLRTGDGLLECGLETPGFQVSEPDSKQVNGSACVVSSSISDEANRSVDVQHQKLPSRLQWHPMMKLSKLSVDAKDGSFGGDGLCHRHCLVTDTMDWPPLQDKSLHFGILDPRKARSTGEVDHRPMDDRVLNLARRLGELGQASELLLREGEVPRCSCQSILASAGGALGPGEDPSETSDALLVLEGLGSDGVGDLGMGGCPKEEFQGPTGPDGEGDVHGRKMEATAAAFSSGTLSGLMRQVQRLAGDATPGPGGDASAGPPTQDADAISVVATALCHSPSRSATPKLGACVLTGSPRAATGEGEKAARGKSRKGSLKVRLSKLFRTRSSSGSRHLTDKRPSLASSTSSGGSLMDVWGFNSTDQDSRSKVQLSRPQSAFSPVPFVPAFTDTFLRGLPRPVPLQPDGQNLSRVDQHPLLCPLSRPDASSFATSLRELEKCGWYWGPMNWEDAEMKLKAKPDGSFLVRDSSDPRYILSLSFRSQGVTHHTRMEHYRGTFSLWCHPKFEDRCHSVVEFIERAIMHSKNGKFLYFLRSRVPGLPPTPVQLLYPVSRFSSVKSLQHLCRFCIRQMVRIDHIQELPLPTPLIVYLRKFYYYDPEEEMYLSIKEVGRDTSTQAGVESQT